jgi:hypothetical protein
MLKFRLGKLLIAIFQQFQNSVKLLKSSLPFISKHFLKLLQTVTYVGTVVNYALNKIAKHLLRH